MVYSHTPCTGSTLSLSLCTRNDSIVVWQRHILSPLSLTFSLSLSLSLSLSFSLFPYLPFTYNELYPGVFFCMVTTQLDLVNTIELRVQCSIVSSDNNGDVSVTLSLSDTCSDSSQSLCFCVFVCPFLTLARQPALIGHRRCTNILYVYQY